MITKISKRPHIQKLGLPIFIRGRDGELLDTPAWLNDPKEILARTKYTRRRAHFTLEIKALNPKLFVRTVFPFKPRKKRIKKIQVQKLVPEKKIKKAKEVKSPLPKKPKPESSTKAWFPLYNRKFFFGPVWCWGIMYQPKKIFDHPKLIAHSLYLGLFETEEEASELHFEELLDLMRIALLDQAEAEAPIELEPCPLLPDPILGFCT